MSRLKVGSKEIYLGDKGPKASFWLLSLAIVIYVSFLSLKIYGFAAEAYARGMQTPLISMPRPFSDVMPEPKSNGSNDHDGTEITR